MTKIDAALTTVQRFAQKHKNEMALLTAITAGVCWHIVGTTLATIVVTSPAPIGPVARVLTTSSIILGTSVAIVHGCPDLYKEVITSLERAEVITDLNNAFKR